MTVPTFKGLRVDCVAWAMLGSVVAVALNWGWGVALRPAGGAVWPWVWALALAPALEEYLLRQGVQSLTLPRLGAWGASALATVAFAMLHLPAHGTLAVAWLVPGAALAWLWQRHHQHPRAWWACAGVHAAWNAALAAASQLNL